MRRKQTTKMTFSNSEPQLASSSSPNTSIQRQRRTINQSLADCCYSISNLALILASILALVFTIKFFSDEALYDFGEHLLGWRFYRQLIYIIVILPLVLLVPLFNAISALFLTPNKRLEFGKGLLIMKIVYQILMCVLVFIGLIFVAPYIRFSGVAVQIGYELRRHMKRRYESDFSYELLEQIQEEFQCCDEIWYSNNYFDKLPLSCYVQDGTYSLVHDQDCATVVGELVSQRCAIIAAGLLIILVALAILISMEINEFLTLSSFSSTKKYNISSREAVNLDQNHNQQQQQQQQQTFAKQPIRATANADNILNGDDDDDDSFVDEISNRLKLHERERAIPLLQANNYTAAAAAAGSRIGVEVTNDDVIVDDPYNSKLRPAPTILTRASYNTLTKDRPQSPVFVSHITSTTTSSSTASLAGGGGGGKTQTPTKSALKKSPSFQRINRSADSQNYDNDDDNDNYRDDDDDDDDDENRMQRESQTRRSLLSVRFADE